MQAHVGARADGRASLLAFKLVSAPWIRVEDENAEERQKPRRLMPEIIDA